MTQDEEGGGGRDDKGAQRSHGGQGSLGGAASNQKQSADAGFTGRFSEIEGTYFLSDNVDTAQCTLGIFRYVFI